MFWWIWKQEMKLTWTTVRPSIVFHGQQGKSYPLQHTTLLNHGTTIAYWVRFQKLHMHAPAVAN